MYEIQYNRNNNSTKTMYFILITLSLILHWPQKELCHCTFSMYILFHILVLLLLRKNISISNIKYILLKIIFQFFKGKCTLISIHLSNFLRRWCGSPLHDCEVSQSIGRLSIVCHVLNGAFWLVIYLWREVRQWRRLNRL